jgi:hypothetical protein
MSRNIRTAHTDDKHAGLNVIIAPHTFTSFRQFLADEEQRTGFHLASQGCAQRLVLPAFEVQVRPFALATFARIFDYDEAMISLIEEAQFRLRCLTVRPLADGRANLSLSDTTDVQFAQQSDSSPSVISSSLPTVVAHQTLRLGTGVNRGAASPPTTAPRIAV